MRRTPSRSSPQKNRSESPEEQRRAPRSAHDSIIELHDGDGHLIVDVGRLSNFSITGMCFSSRRALERGDTIHAELRLLKEGRIQISGKVVWVKRAAVNHIYGVEFFSIRPNL